MKIKNCISIVQSGEFPLALNTAVDFLYLYLITLYESVNLTV